MKVRYEDQPSYLINVPKTMHNMILPKLTLQPIIENALTHGFNGSSTPREVSITGTVENNTLRLIIRDNGKGFSADSLMHLRNAFKQMEINPSAFSSAGREHLGLTNTYLRLLHASKGNIRMTLSNDNGAVITFNITIEKIYAAYKILIVDDEMPALRYLRSIVEKYGQGYEVANTCTSGEAALAHLQKEHIDLLLTDISMPTMDGITLALKARDLQPDIHIIIVTGYADFEYAKGAIQASVEDYILKPIVAFLR